MQLTSTLRPPQQIKQNLERKLKCLFPPALQASEGVAVMEQPFAVRFLRGGEETSKR